MVLGPLCCTPHKKAPPKYLNSFIFSESEHESVHDASLFRLNPFQKNSEPIIMQDIITFPWACHLKSNSSHLILVMPK